MKTYLILSIQNPNKNILLQVEYCLNHKIKYLLQLLSLINFLIMKVCLKKYIIGLN